MVVVAIPDVMAAIVAHLRASSEIQALVTDRIGIEARDAWMFKTAVLVSHAGGSGDAYLPVITTRVSVRTFAPKYAHNAHDLFRTVHSYLMRPDGGPNGFKRGACVVYSVQHEGGPTSVPEFMGSGGRVPWPCFLSSYLIMYSMVPQ